MTNIFNWAIRQVSKYPFLFSSLLFITGVSVFSIVIYKQVLINNTKLQNESQELEVKLEEKIAGVFSETAATIIPKETKSFENTPIPKNTAILTPTPAPTSATANEQDSEANSQGNEAKNSVPTSTPTPQSSTFPTATITPSPGPVQGICWITANKTEGSAPLTIQFYYSASYEDSDNWVTAVQWDFEGDGQWDTELAFEEINKRPTFEYSEGEYTVKMRVQLKNGFITEICTKKIKALPESE